MKKLFTIFLALALLPFSLEATEVVITGKVYFGEVLEPIADYPVTYRVLGPVFEEGEAITDQEGEYVVTLDLDFTATPEIPVLLEVFDFCNGFLEAREIIIDEDGAISGATDFNVCMDIFPPPPPEGCDAYFGYDQLDPNTFMVQFYDLSYSSAPVDSWAWDFGDGNISSEPAPVHTYDTTGEYSVTLTITADTCSSTITMPVYVNNLTPCFCDGDFNPVCVIGPDGEVVTLPNACFAECLGYGPDSFVDCEGCDCPFVFDPVCVIGDAGEEISFPNACVAECEGYLPADFVNCSGPVDCPCPLIFDPVCVVADGDTLQFENACFAECEGFTPDEYFSCAPLPCDCGPEFAPVCVLDPDGIVLLFPNACFAECEGYSSDDFTDCNNVGFDDCFASFYYGLDPQLPTSVSFFDDSFTSDGVVTSWSWNFGDGTISNEQNPVHQYAADGVYEVILTITTSEGCTSSTVQHLCVGEGGVFPGPECQAMFFFEQDMAGLNTFTFFDFSFAAADSWAWDFGDGNTSSEQNPTHTYDNPGTYLVTLTITAGDCESSISMLIFTADNILYNNECTALFLPLIIPDSNQVFFLNLSSPDAVSFEWDFGDGTTSSEFIASHEYAAGGSYNVTLTITTADGCSNTFMVTINLNGSGLTANPSFSLLSNTAEEQPDKITSISAYPNPVSTELTIELENAEAGSCIVELWTMNGQLAQNKAYVLQDMETQRLSISLAGLPNGLYLLKVEHPSGAETLRIMKQ